MIQSTINRRNRVWQSLAIGVVMIVILLRPLLAVAAIQEVSVIGVGVSNSPNKAKAIALEYARKRAVFLQMAKMKVDNADARAAALTPAQLGRIIRGANIKQLKRDGDVTYADVSVSIIDTILRQELALDRDDRSDVAAQMRGILVLPVYVVGDRPYVWEKENALREQLRDEVLRQSHGAVVVPSGDFDDLRLIDYRNALTVKASDMKPMFERYGVDEIIIAVIARDDLQSAEPVAILMRRLMPDGVRVEQITLPAATATESIEKRLSDAVKAVAAAATEISASTSHAQQAKLSEAIKIPITFRYGNMREIATMQTAMRDAEGVMQLSIPVIELNQMKGVLYLSGEKDAVRKALAKKSLIVTDHEGGWMVSLR